MSVKTTLLLLTIIILPMLGLAQKKGEAVKHDKEVRDMVAFLQYMLNTLGDPETPNRDKDVVVMESFNRIFRDGKVQVEDDLDEDRKVITNKDVQAYLKDVDFFYRKAKFEFIVEKIETRGTFADKLVYRVALKRNLQGVNIYGKEVNSTIPRFIEINYNDADQDLKIVSIYTNEFDEKSALKAWWQSLSYEWQSIFRRQLDLTDSVSVRDIKKMTSLDTLVLADNQFIQNIDPLSFLLDLTIVDLSGTNVSDLTPIRNLTNLRSLDISRSRVTDLSPLRYATSLEKLDVSETKVDSLNVIERLSKLSSLDISNTTVKDFSPLRFGSALKVLNLSRTSFSDASLLDSLGNLTTLNLSHTPVKGISALGSLQKLSVIDFDSVTLDQPEVFSKLAGLKVAELNHTNLDRLDEFEKLPELQRIYCDHTPIGRKQADAFAKLRPQVLVIYASDDLRGWWSDLTPVWKDVLSRRARISLTPSKEELAKLTSIDSVSLANYRSIKDLLPLVRLEKLEIVVANNSGITNIEPLSALSELRSIDISGTEVSDVSPLASNRKLRVLLADGTKVETIDTLQVLPLERLFVDGTLIDDEDVKKFQRVNSKCLIVYKTSRLEEWWTEMPEEWRQAFQLQINVNTKPTRQNFHRLISLERLEVRDIPVRDLDVLHEFTRLKELVLLSTAVSSVGALSAMTDLKLLHIQGSAVRELSPLRSLTSLSDLDISNTPVEELEPIGSLRQLTKFNCAGTKVRKLDPLENLSSLTYLDCSNTDVRTLKDVERLSLRVLRCFNTKISAGNVSSFKEKNPECQVTYYR